MTTMITGRKLDGRGNPIDATGFAYDGDGRLAELLAQRNSPLFSEPVTGEWVFGLISRAETGGESERGVGVFPAGNAGPPMHFHPSYDEYFEVVQGEFMFTIGGNEQKAQAGDQLVARKNTPHTFRCVGEGFGALIAETRPAARIGDVIATLFGLAHEGKVGPQGQPKFLQAVVMGSEYADDTVFTTPPPAIVLPMSNIFAPFARLLGYRSSYAEHLKESFWNARVEQPERINVVDGEGRRSHSLDRVN
jgi:quercetin dioxygenase-like cupin family protein